MNLKEITNREKWVRVLDSTYLITDADEQVRKLIGKDVKVVEEDYKDNTICVDSNATPYWFNRSDVAELTPLSFSDRRIAIGDEVRAGTWGLVYGYHWDDGEWLLNVAKEGDFNDCYVFDFDELDDHRLQNISKSDLTDSELLAEVERRGLVVEGKVLK